MNQRVHIHKEELSIVSEVRHFLIVLPPDVAKITNIKVTATPEMIDPELHHEEAGRLRLSRDGFFLCDMPVWIEGIEPYLSPIGTPGIGNSSQVYVGGKHAYNLAIEIPGEVTVLTCRHECNKDFVEFTLTVYIYYEPKT